jgi:threonylcarbamoyladenosine tRNA methylthiotransferase MtaB
MTGQRVAITTLGCKINQFESAAMHELLGGSGYELVPFDQDAEVYIVNTCTVTARSDAESRKLIRRTRRRSPSARIVVTGCYAQIDPDSIAAMPEVDLVIGNGEKKALAALLAEVGGDRVRVSDISREGEISPLRLETHADHTRAFLQIQNGCDAFCSYCIVPYARGRSRSVPFDEALEGVRTFARKGFREVVLTGIHLGAFGFDLSPRRTLLELLEAIEAEVTVPRLRLGSLEPGEVTDDLIDFLARSRIVCPHLHIPLQSGDDAVLIRMNRRYTADFFRDRVARLAQAVPDIFIGMDVIAGFPGETDAEFARTVSFLEELPIAALHVFPYSPRPGTPAADLPNRVPGPVAKERVRALLCLSERKREEFHGCFVGRELEVLLQQLRTDGFVEGLTRNYIPVTVSGAADLTMGSEIMVHLEQAGVDHCRGIWMSHKEVAHAVFRS